MSAISSYGSFANYGAGQGATLTTSAARSQGNYQAAAMSSSASQTGVYCATCNSGTTAAKAMSPASTYCPTCNKSTPTRTSAAITNAARNGSAVNAGGRMTPSCPTCNASYARNR